MIQSNARFGLTDRLEVHLDHVRMPAAKGERAEKTKGRSLDVIKIIVFDGLNPDRVMFSGNSLSDKKLHLLYDRDSEHYNVITNPKGVMAKQYICNGCDTLYDKTHKCDKVFSSCSATPPCTKDQTKYCGICNKLFLSENYIQNHLTHKVKGKIVCQ